ncbi:MAG: DUF3800 domain-containing protein [Clostridia bacterium]|nr:DUF3800 domain-containing protein [Clostridia bacterium]
MNHGEPGGFDKESNKLKPNTSRYFTVAGFMINSNQILDIEKELKDVKIKNKIGQENEIKWHTTYSKLGMDFKQYSNVREEVMSIIAKYKGSVIGIIMDKESCYQNKEYIKTPNDLYSVALHLLMERSCMQTTKKWQKENLEPTMVIADSRQSINSSKLDNELKIAYSRAKNMGTHFMKFPSFCESIMFADSKDLSGIQLADFCAGAIHKKYEREDEEYFNLLLPAIVNKEGNIYGPGIKLYK